MGDSITLEAKKRDLNGPKPNALRASGSTPAVIHDHGKDSHHIVVDEAELKKVYSQAGKHTPVDLKVEDKKFTTLIKEVTHKPASSMVYHTVFQAVSANETVTAEIPLKLSEEIPAERASLLVVNGVTTVEVEALPKDLVDQIEVDASVLVEAGDKIVVGDIKAPAGITITTEPETLVAAVEVPKDQVAEADAAAAELADQSAGKPAADADAEAADEEE